MGKHQVLERMAGEIGLDFYALRKDGIALLQDLCSASWTDYNLHDPGVTTLEQLCYALTDLAYRTDFGVADYLTAATGKIDYQGLALYPPQEILPSQALTANDYRKLIFDAIPRVDEVWVWPAAARHGGKGLMSIFVMPENEFEAPDVAPLPVVVKALYAQNRSLCEDLASVIQVRPRPFLLKGVIEIEHGREPAEILAQVIADCGDFVSSGMTAMRFQDALKQTPQLDQLFEGPATQQGYIGTLDSADHRSRFAASELIAVIQAVPGVRRVRNLCFRFKEGHESAELLANPASGFYPRLKFPNEREEYTLLQLVPPQGIVFGVSEGTIPLERVWRERNRAMYADAELLIKKLDFERLAFRTDKEEGAAHKLALPKGQYRDFGAYYSVQHQFPAVYGINDAGVPSSADEQRKVEALQLKAYLFPFEQLMANYLRNLDELPLLFSPATATRQSYFAQYLDPRTIAGIDALYDPAAPLPQTAGGLPPGHDDYFERKGRVLDYLLALYGEEFPQSSLRRFSHYHRERIEEWLLEAKATLLRELVELGGRRATAFNYLKGSEHELSVPRLQRRAGILLGMHEPQRQHSFGEVLRENGLTLVDDGAFDRGAHPDHASEQDENDKLPRPAPADPADPVQPSAETPLPFLYVSERFLRHGCSLHNYGMAVKNGQTVLYFVGDTGRRALKAFSDHQQAQEAARGYAATLARINLLSEGMHIVEHILLRPRAARRYSMDTLGAGENFFASRISVVLSGWTLRCYDAEFKNFAEDTVSEHCPAHIYPSFHWLEPGEMQRFEADHSQWREALQNYEQTSTDANMELLDAAAEPLARFLATRIAGKK